MAFPISVSPRDLEDDNIDNGYSLPDSLLADVSKDESTTWRYKTLGTLNPYLAKNPQTLVAMANLPNSPEWQANGWGNKELFNNAAALYGMQVGNDLVNQLPKYSPSTQRAIFAGLTAEQQISLRGFGYTPPTYDVHDNGFFNSAVGKLILKPISLTARGLGAATTAPIIGPALNVLMEAGDFVVGKPYRTIKQLDGVSQYLALGAFVAGTLLTGGLYVPIGGTAAALGTAALGGVAAATGTSFLYNTIANGSPSVWINAWNRAFHGERLFGQEGIKEATELLKDPLLLTIAADLADQSEKPFDLYKLAEQVVGRREGGDLNVQINAIYNVAKNYATEGTEQFNSVYNSLVDLLKNDNFQAALQALEKSKISVGRDIVRGIWSVVGADPDLDSGWGRVMSGAIDGALLWSMDPLLLAGNVTRAIGAARYGMQFTDGWQMANRFRKIASMPKVARKMDLVAEAVSLGKPKMLIEGGARDMLPLYSSLRQHYLQVSELAEKADKTLTWGGKQITEWIIGTDQMSSLMRGIGYVNGTSYGIVKGIGPTRALVQQNVLGPVREFIRGINDLKLEDAITKVLDHPEIGAQLVDSLHGIDDALVSEVMQVTGLADREARIITRMMTNIPAQTTLGMYLSGKWLDATPEEIRRTVADYLFTATRDAGTAYRLGRVLSDAPDFLKQIGFGAENLNLLRLPLRGFGNFIEGITTLVPPGGIHLVGSSSTEEIIQYVEMFRHANVPSYVRNAWVTALLDAPTGGARMNAVSAFIDSIASGAGMRLTNEGNELLNKFLYKMRQEYSLGSAGLRAQFFDEDLVVPVGARPVQDMAVMIPIPDLKTIRRAVRQGKFIEAMYGIPADQVILGFQNRIWKPAVLLRLGFITRNVGEEVLGFITRYGFGSMAQEFGARGLAQKEVHKKALLEAKALSQQKNLSEFESYVIRQNWDLPAHMRPVARIVERLGKTGLPRYEVVEGAIDYLKTFIGNYTGYLHNFLENGLGWGSGARMKYASIDERTLATSVNQAKTNFDRWWNQLAYGNEYSLRRMLAGGVNPELVQSAELFEGVYFRSIMEKIGTSRNAPWQGIRTAPTDKRLILGEDDDEHLALVHISGERTLNTATKQMPNQQPWWDSVVAQRQWLFDDPVVAEALRGVAKIYGSELQRALPPEVVKEVLSQYWKLAGSGKVKIDKDFLQLWSLLERGSFDRRQFDALLMRMKIDLTPLEARLNDLIDANKIDSNGADKVLAWARNRNQLVASLTQNFPGQVKPTWAQVSDVLYSESALYPADTNFILMRTGDGRIAPSERMPLTVDFTTGEIVSPSEAADIFGFLPAYGKLEDQFKMFDEMSYALRDVVDPSARDWMNQVVYNWHADHEWIAPEQLDAWLTDPEALSPFHETLVDAADEITQRAMNAFTAPEIQSSLLNNQDWTGQPIVRDAYVVDFRNFKPGQQSLYGELQATNFANLEPARRALADAGFEWINNPLAGQNADAFIMRILDSIENGTPFVVSSEAAARQVAHATAILEGNGFQVGMRPPVARTWFPKDPGEGIFESKKVFARVNWSKSGEAMPQQKTFEVFDFPEAELASATAGNQLYWEYLDDLKRTPAPEAVVDRVLAHIEQNIRSGRRQGIYVKTAEGAPPVYRNVNGRPVQVEPGERIDDLEETLYNSDRLDPKSIINPADRVYFDRSEVAYAPTSNELLWPILGPVMIDHLEGNLGMQLYEISNPVNAHGFSANHEPQQVFVDRKRVRYTNRKHVENTPAGDLPDWEIAQLYRLDNRNVFDKLTEKGFKVFGKIIDSISRKPMAFHAFHIAAQRNKNAVSWLISGSREEADLAKLVDKLESSGGKFGRTITTQQQDLWGEAGRLIGQLHGDVNATKWTNMQAVYYLRGHTLDELPEVIESARTVLGTDRAAALLGADFEATRAKALIDFLETNLDNLHSFPAAKSGDDLIKFVEDSFGPGSIERGRPIYDVEKIKDKKALDFLNELQPQDWAVLRRSKNQREIVKTQVADYAAEATIRDLMPYIDSHEIRSQFASQYSGLLPFWYAEENFLKRWAKMLTEGGPGLTLSRIRNLQLRYLGIREMGVIRTDAQGRDYVVIPGSGLMVDLISRLLPGADAIDPQSMLQMDTSRILPGFGAQFGTPSPSPLIGLSLGLVEGLFPEVQPIQRALVGEQGMFRSIAANIVPAQLINTYDALTALVGDGGGVKFTSATVQALANMDAAGLIPSDLSEAQMDEILRTARRHARVIVVARALAGWTMPSSATEISGVEGGTLSFLTDGAVKVPSEILSSEYYELIGRMGIEDGTLAYLELYPDNGLKDIFNPLAFTVSRTETRSGAALPSSDEAIEFYNANWDWYNQYVMAGPWALPQSDGSKRSQYAYEIEVIDGMRRSRAPEEFLRELKFKEGATEYFRQKDRFDRGILAAPENKDEILRAWDAWSYTWKQGHPVFAAMLVDGDAKNRRKEVIKEMRSMLADPEAPAKDLPHWQGLVLLQKEFDDFQVAYSYSSLSQKTADRNARKVMQELFVERVNKILLEYPQVESYWLTVIRPESGVD